MTVFVFTITTILLASFRALRTASLVRISQLDGIHLSPIDRNLMYVFPMQLGR
jgi:hypothetical protein